jgi:urocanate hydratase
MRTHEWAPRVLIANSNLVPEWATWDEFRRLEELGPDDVRADDRRAPGSTSGARGIVQGTYECFAEIARRRFEGSLAGNDHADGRASAGWAARSRSRSR